VRKKRVAAAVFLLMLSLLILMSLLLTIWGAVIGSFDWFPRDAAIKRAIYIAASVMLSAVLIAVIKTAVKLLKTR
jgi:hypothetical protein